MNDNSLKALVSEWIAQDKAMNEVSENRSHNRPSGELAIPPIVVDPPAVKMRNQYAIRQDKRGKYAAILVHHHGTSNWYECLVDLPDLERLLSLRTTWYANPARKSKTRFYVQARLWAGGEDKTVMIHRFILSATRGYEVHHEDNNPLNNRRYNIEQLTKSEHEIKHHSHREGYRDEYLARPLTAEYRTERLIAKQVQAEFDLCRQQVWRIRTGRTSGTLSAAKYHTLLSAANVRSLEELMLTRPVENEKWGTRRVKPKLSNIG